MEVKKECEECGNVFYVPHWRGNAKYCCRECSDKAKIAKNNLVCTNCGKQFHEKPSLMNRHKRTCGYFCCKECFNEYRKTWFRGANNHQYGLKGNLNSSFKGDEIYNLNNNIVDIRVYCHQHPYADSAGRVLKHRLIVEQNANLFDERYFIKIDGKRYLKQDIDVHHKNFNHDDNRIENLEPMTRAEHTSLHNTQKEIIRDKKGRIVSVIDHTPRIIKIKKLFDGVNIPQKQHIGDAAFDVFTPKQIEIHKGRNLIPLGFAIELPKGYAALIRSRSGFSLKGMESSDGERHDADVITGLIDENYRGEVGVIIKSDEDFVLDKGIRIGQMLPYKVPNVEFVEVDELGESERGTSGYGSTGK